MTNEELHLIKRALAAINTVGHLAQNDFNQFPIDAADNECLTSSRKASKGTSPGFRTRRQILKRPSKRPASNNYERRHPSSSKITAISRAPAKSDTRDGLPEKQGSAFNLRYGTVPLDLVEAFLQVLRPL